MRRRRRIIYLGILPVFCAAVLFLWTERAERDAHFVPDYEEIDLEFVLDKAELTEEDYSVIFAQTGLAGPGEMSFTAWADRASCYVFRSAFLHR